tara:strand:- start:3483 stop:3686 length:204 start_codon:yes stop_codon:yes gene_type:complete
MVRMNLGRIAIVAATAILSQSLLGGAIGGFVPATLAVGAVSLAGVISTGIGVVVGEMIADNIKQTKR